jgi:hypothetical protein
MPIPNDRGYVTVKRARGQSYDLTVHSGLTRGRPDNPYAFYRQMTVVVDSPLVLKRAGDMLYSDHVVHVYPDVDGTIHVAEPSRYVSAEA